MTEPVQLYQRASGTWAFVCTVNFHRHVYAPVSKPNAAGLSFWCRDCKAEHNLAWLSLLTCVRHVVGPEALREILTAALAALPPARTTTWRAEE